jgi:hypothetical protein
MSYPKSPVISDLDPLIFLEQYPTLAKALLRDCAYNYQEVVGIVENILKAPHRCQVVPLYIQAVVTGHTTFLITNLNRDHNHHLTNIASTWLIGRAPTCAITIADLSVSRCHAVVGFHPVDGFYITDIGSTNGTWVNRHRLPLRQRRTLHDGELLQFGKRKVEFFLISRQPIAPSPYEMTYS